MFHWWRSRLARAGGAAAVGVWWRSGGARRRVALWRAAEGRRVKCDLWAFCAWRSGWRCRDVTGSVRLGLRRVLSSRAGRSGTNSRLAQRLDLLVP